MSVASPKKTSLIIGPPMKIRLGVAFFRSPHRTESRRRAIVSVLLAHPRRAIDRTVGKLGVRAREAFGFPSVIETVPPITRSRTADWFPLLLAKASRSIIK